MFPSRVRFRYSIELLTGVDHVVSASSNGLIAVLVGRYFGARELGVFTLSYTAYLVANAINRALVSEPLLASLRTSDVQNFGRAAAVSLYTSALGSAVLISASLLLENRVLLAFACGLPVLSLHDTARLRAFRNGSPGGALKLDLPWFAVTIAAWPLAPLLSVSQLTWLWILGAAVGFITGSSVPKIVPPRAALKWWRSEVSDLGGALIFEGAVFHAASYGTIFIITALAGLAELGRFRSAQLLMTPALMIPSIIALIATPQIANRATPAGRWFLAKTLASYAGVAMIPISLAWAGLVWTIQSAIFPEDLRIPAGFALLLALQTVFAATATPMSSFSRVARLRADILGSRLISTAVGVVLVTALTLLFGVLGALAALCLQSLVYATCLAGLLKRRLGRDVSLA